jgi:hypothetical protein
MYNQLDIFQDKLREMILIFRLQIKCLLEINLRQSKSLKSFYKESLKNKILRMPETSQAKISIIIKMLVPK